MKYCQSRYKTVRDYIQILVVSVCVFMEKCLFFSRIPVKYFLIKIVRNTLRKNKKKTNTNPPKIACSCVKNVWKRVERMSGATGMFMMRSRRRRCA